MDEKKKETEQENPVDTGAETSAEVEGAAEKVDEPSSEVLPTAENVSTASAESEVGAPLKKNKRLISALIRVGCALIAAALLLTVTNFSIFELKKGATKTNSAQNEETGSFVKQDVYLLLGDLSEQGLSGNYMLAALVDKIVVVRFTDRYLASAAEIKNDTLKFIGGEITTIDKYVTVEGTVEKQSEDLSGKVYEWFDANKSWMQEKGVITETNDAATYLSDAVLMVDTVNSMSETLVYALTVLAALCLIYIIVELILMACGVYLKEPKKRKLAMSGAVDVESDESDESDDEAQEIAETSDETDEELHENADECKKDEQKPEDNGSPEEPSEEKTQEQEDK